MYDTSGRGGRQRKADATQRSSEAQINSALASVTFCLGTTSQPKGNGLPASPQPEVSLPGTAVKVWLLETAIRTLFLP